MTNDCAYLLAIIMLFTCVTGNGVRLTKKREIILHLSYFAATFVVTIKCWLLIQNLWDHLKLCNKHIYLNCLQNPNYQPCQHNIYIPWKTRCHIINSITAECWDEAKKKKKRRRKNGEQQLEKWKSKMERGEKALWGPSFSSTSGPDISELISHAGVVCR